MKRLKNIVLCVSTNEKKNGDNTTENRYYISSLHDISLLSQEIRGHWDPFLLFFLLMHLS